MSRIIALRLAFAFVCIFALTRANSIGRVVGGIDALEGRFPYQISLRFTDRHTCGGSIISPKIIVTAAHCVLGKDVKQLTVRAGSLNRFKGGVLLNVAKYIIHENYADNLNDIAILLLEKALVFSKNIQPIKLASSPYVDTTPVILSGWGRVKEEGDVPRYLQHLTLSTLSKDNCMNRLNLSTVVCIDHVENFGVCNGDSGGPAAWNNELIGVASFKSDVCGSENPDGYTDVYQFVDWINKNAGL